VADTYNLQRFVDAQDAHGTYDRVTDELRRGRKTSHWMWFVFPQIAGLGYSATSRKYAITSLDEAQAYLAHPILGPRLRECANLMLQVQERSARQVLGDTDAQKLQSSMTPDGRAPLKPGPADGTIAWASSTSCLASTRT
jgi:uncharacterized protein (DUF1810 family)